MNRILYRLFGSLTLSCEGGFVGQFLDMCRAAGVAFRNARCKNGKLYIEVTPSELYTLRHIARETGMRVKVLSRTGLVFIIHRYRRRAGLLVGFAVFMLIMYHLSGFVWNVDIIGESRFYTREQITAALEENGIAVGKRISDIKVSHAENNVLTKLDGLKRLAVSINSTTVTAEIADRVAPPEPSEEESTGRPADIASKSDAYIISVVPYAGKALVKPGDTVTKGQTLVSGMYEDSAGRTYLTESKAEVIGQVTRTAEFEISVFNEKEEPTGEIYKKTSLFFYGMEINFYIEGGNRYTKCDIITGRKQLTLFGKQLPIAITTVTEKELAVDARPLTDEELEGKIAETLKKYEQESLSGEIVSRSAVTELDGDICRVSVTYVCNEDIGQKTEISIQ